MLVVGRSPAVLDGTVALLRSRGHRADATSEFAHVLERADLVAVDVVVFGGMVAPDVKQRLREGIAGRNPGVVFVQGFAGIPGLIAAQVQAATGPHPSQVGAEIDYESRSRSVRVSLSRASDVAVVAWWHTAFVPPNPDSTCLTVLHGPLPAGPHTAELPEQVPDRASFVTVSVGAAVSAFIVGPMPGGTSLAQFPDPADS